MVAASTSTVNDGAVTIFVVVVLAACALYMAPTIVAIARRVPNAGRWRRSICCSGGH